MTDRASISVTYTGDLLTVQAVLVNQYDVLRLIEVLEANKQLLSAPPKPLIAEAVESKT